MTDIKDNLSLPQQFKILVVGQTGVGKSTIINTLVNYFRKGNLDDVKVAIPTQHYGDVTEKDLTHDHSKEKVEDQAASQTSECFDYVFHSDDGCKYTFIDTPGLSDIRGKGQDDKNIEKIITSAYTHEYLNAILFIVNGTESRLHKPIANTFKRLASYLPDNLGKKNVLLILSKSKETSAVFQLKDFEKMVTEPKEVYYMDNTLFCKHPDEWRNVSKMRRNLSRDWEDSMDTIEDILKITKKMDSISTNGFKEIETYRDHIRSTISQNMKDIQGYYVMRQQLINQKKSVDHKKTITYTETISSNNKNIICNNCNKNCFKDILLKIFNIIPLLDCEKCRCSFSSHEACYYIIQERTKIVEDVLKNIEATHDIDKKLSDLDKIKSATDKTFDNIKLKSLELKIKCNKFNFIEELSANIENMKKILVRIDDSELKEHAKSKIQGLTDFFKQQSPSHADLNN